MGALQLALLARHRDAVATPWPQPAQPDGQRTEYFKALQAYVAKAAALLRARVEPLLARLQPVRTDSGSRVDADGEDSLLRAIEAAAAELVREAPVATLAGIAERSAWEISDFQRMQMRQAFRDMLGIDLADVFATEPYLEDIVRDFTRENVSLIRSVSSDYFAQVERELLHGVRAGWRPEKLGQLIAERTGVAESRAALVARDQVGKLYGNLNVERQKAAGVTRFRWRDVRDNRVRKTHRNLNGQVFPLDKPPPEGHPGQPVNCRCWAEPVLDDILKAPARPAGATPAPKPAGAARAAVGTRTPAGALPLRSLATKQALAGKARPLATRAALAKVKKRSDWRHTREYLVPIDELYDIQVKEWEPTRSPQIERAIDEGKFLTLPPIRVVTDPLTGLREVSDGNHRLSVARRRGEKFIKVRFLDKGASDIRWDRPPGAPSFPDVHAR